MLELYKNGLVADLQCRYADLIAKLSKKMSKALPCEDMVTDSKVVVTLLKRLRDYNGLDREILNCSKICINRSDEDDVTITIIINDIPFNYSGNGTEKEISYYFSSSINNALSESENIHSVTFSKEDNCFYIYTDNENVELEINYVLSSSLLIHNNYITVENNCSPYINCKLLDRQNCLSYTEFCSMYNKVDYILNKYKCKC